MTPNTTPAEPTRNATCQAMGCDRDACWETYASNDRGPEGGTQVCDRHLAEPGLCVRPHLPTPESYTVVAIHEGSPPYCLVTCPTCHPAPQPDTTPDFLQEMIDERAAQDPDFHRLVAEASVRRAITFAGCARCGGEHADLPTERLIRPFAPSNITAQVWSHWAMCPATAQPILVAMVDDPQHVGPDAPTEAAT